jgi:quercetin dioxygenase-like cupin family protein
METTDRRETTEAAAITVPPDGGATVWLLGDTYTLKITGEQTGGAFALLEALVPPNSGPPPHRHLREDETFVVLEGALEFRANRRTVPAPAGTVIHVPRGTVHSYATVGTAPVRMLFLYAPAGMERMFAEIGTPAQPGVPAPPLIPEDVARLLSVAAKYQFEVVEPGGA